MKEWKHGSDTWNSHCPPQIWGYLNYIPAQCWSDAESWTTQRLCYGLFPAWSLLLCGVTNGNAKIRTGVFKCKEVGRIMTFLFSCLAIHTEAFLFLCHSGWHIINSCLICCLRALLPMQEALNPYTAVRDKTPVGPLPPRFNNKTEESSTQQSISGFLFRSTHCYSLHKCHLQRSRRISSLHISLQIFRSALKFGWRRWVFYREKKGPSSQDLWSTSAPRWPWSAPAFIAPSTPFVLPPFSPSHHKKSRDDPSVPLFLWPAPSPPPGCFLFQNPLRHPPMNRWRNEKWRCDPNFVLFVNIWLLFFLKSFTSIK